MAGQTGFFDVDERYAALSAAADPLDRLADVVDFEVFRPVLDAALARSDRSRGARPPYDARLKRYSAAPVGGRSAGAAAARAG